MITSSTTTAASPEPTVNPRRSDICFGGRVPFREKKTGTQRARHFVPDDQAAQGRRDHQVDLAGAGGSAQFLRQQAAQLFGGAWMLQHQRALQVLARCAARW